MFEKIAKDAIETQAETTHLLDQRNDEMVQPLQPNPQARKLDDLICEALICRC